ncbi:hypothetical protein Tco_1300003, partial [Tanacetum coccineum]
MMIQAPEDMGEDSAALTDSHSTPIRAQEVKEEDASKQGRKIDDLDADAEVTLIDKTQERFDEEMLFYA